MNLKEIKEIINLMEQYGLAEIELEREGGKLKIRKSLAGHVDIVAPVAAVAPSRAATPLPAAAPKEETPKKLTKDITAPMIGTFYRAPSPEAPPYVELGQVIEVGQVVCIVEAMKLMNEIKSDIRGKVVEIPVDNAEPVEFGQTLFVLEPL